MVTNMQDIFTIIVQQLERDLPHVQACVHEEDVAQLTLDDDRMIQLTYAFVIDNHEITIVINDQVGSFNEFTKAEIIQFAAKQVVDVMVTTIKQKIENLGRSADRAREDFQKQTTMITTYSFEGIIQSPIPHELLQIKDTSLMKYGEVRLSAIAEALAKNDNDIRTHLQKYPYLDHWSATRYYHFLNFAITEGDFKGVTGHRISPHYCLRWAHDIEQRLNDAKTRPVWHCDDMEWNGHVYANGWRKNVLSTRDREEIIQNIEGFIAFLRRAVEYNQNVLQI